MVLWNRCYVVQGQIHDFSWGGGENLPRESAWVCRPRWHTRVQKSGENPCAARTLQTLGCINWLLSQQVTLNVRVLIVWMRACDNGLFPSKMK